MSFDWETKRKESFKTTYARLKAKRDAIRNGVPNPRPRQTPFAHSFSKRSKPKASG